MYSEIWQLLKFYFHLTACRGDDIYEEDYPRHGQRQRQSEYKDDDEGEDDENARDSGRRTKTREMTVHSDQRTSQQKTTRNVT